MSDPNDAAHDAFWKAHNDYFNALGRFIHTFAGIEAQLQTLLWVEAQTDTEIAKAVFCGVRVDGAKDFINRITDAQGRERDPVLTRAFAQLGDITRTRNDIVHYGASFQEDGAFKVSNHLAAHIPAKLREFPVTPAVLKDMVADLQVISASIARYLFTKAPADKLREHPDFVEMVNRWDSAATTPWRYKPPQQSPPPKATR